MEAAGIKPIKTPYQASKANAYAGRFVRSFRQECLSWIILIGEGRLRLAIGEYLAHYNNEWNH